MKEGRVADAAASVGLLGELVLGFLSGFSEPFGFLEFRA